MTNANHIAVAGIPAFDDNYIWALHGGDLAVVVDPGDAAPVSAWLAANGKRLVAIVITHHHGDHAGGIAALAAAASLPVFGPAGERIAGVTHPVRGGDCVDLPGLDTVLQVIDVPGHTAGHIAYYGPSLCGTGALFCGDTLFAAGCGRLFEGTAAQMQHSLATLIALPTATQVFCAHEYTQSNLRFATAVEPDNAALAERVAAVAARRARHEPTVPFALADELATNPFVRWDAPAVRAAAADRLGHAPRDAVETFAAIREWKNGFR